jgi:hypothetical protein
VGEFGMGALREADGGIAIAKCGLEGSAELSGIEQAANVGFGEVRAGHSLGFVANLFYRKKDGCISWAHFHEEKAPLLAKDARNGAPGTRRGSLGQVAEIFTVDIGGVRKAESNGFVVSCVQRTVDLWNPTKSFSNSGKH